MTALFQFLGCVALVFGGAVVIVFVLMMIWAGSVSEARPADLGEPD